jgi:hypothetical protein
MSEISCSSNWKESAAVLKALVECKWWLKENRGGALTVRSDNSATVCNLQRKGAGRPLREVTRNIFKVLMKHNVQIAVTHIRGLDNGEVDALSRMDANVDYALKAEMFWKYVEVLEVMPTMDLFASYWNAKLPRFVALAGPQAEGAEWEDAFVADSWQTLIPYAFPPIALIPRVLQRIWREGITAVVVLPKWTGQAWWSLFRELAEVYVEIGDTKEILVPGPNMIASESKKEVPPGVLVMGRLRRRL